MVAHTGTTRVLLDPTDAFPGGDFPAIPSHLHNRILSELCHPGSSLVSVAHDHRISVSELAIWLGEPETRAKMLAIEKGGYAHTRMAASVTLASTVDVMHTIIQDYTKSHAHARQLREQHERLAPPGSRYDPLPPSDYHQHPDRAFLPGEAILSDTSYRAQRLAVRHAECVRRAAHHLYRLSRIIPVDDSKLARAARCIERTASVNERTSASHRTANVSERMSSSDSSLPSPTLHASGGAGILQDLHAASSLKDDADSFRVACVLAEQACPDEHASSTTPEGTHGCESAARPPETCTSVSHDAPTPRARGQPAA